MFTGIVEEVGVVERMTRGTPAAKLVIRADRVIEGTRIGDSISIDGVCLTVVRASDKSLTFDVQAETVHCTICGTYRAGTHVNLERALTPVSRMGGHYVQGHVDGTATVQSWRQEGADWVLSLRLPAPLLRYMVMKGFVAVNGISLTVARRAGAIISCHIIPHSRAATTLQHARAGDTVNIEVDVMAKYVEALAR